MALISETNISWQMCLSPYLWLLPMSLFQRKSHLFQQKLAEECDSSSFENTTQQPAFPFVLRMFCLLHFLLVPWDKTEKL